MPVLLVRRVIPAALCLQMHNGGLDQPLLRRLGRTLAAAVGIGVLSRLRATVRQIRAGVTSSVTPAAELMTGLVRHVSIVEMDL